MATNLLSIPTLVESPFIVVDIDGVTLGSFSGDFDNRGVGTNIEYPNYVTSMEVTKVNGAVNTYAINFLYQVPPGGDPNLLDKIFSRVSKSREIILKYGDWNSPNYIYKEERCVITNITSTLNMTNATIAYKLECTSNALALSACTYTFPARIDKPSNILLEMIRSAKYGLSQVFTGMQNTTKILSSNLIASNDKVVKLLPQNKVTPLDYMNYLVGSMVNASNTVLTGLTNSAYFLSIHDDYTNHLGGTYFKVQEVQANTQDINQSNIYTVDINYPTDNFITEFSLNDDQSWSLLYQFEDNVSTDKFSYIYDDTGKVINSYSPTYFMTANGRDLSPYKSQWWTKMTQFPITATLKIKGLTRPSILMSYVRVNTWFTGAKKHISSGLYIITKQVDSISAEGYSTTLTLLRVGGD